MALSVVRGSAQRIQSIERVAILPPILPLHPSRDSNPVQPQTHRRRWGSTNMSGEFSDGEVERASEGTVGSWWYRPRSCSSQRGVRRRCSVVSAVEAGRASPTPETRRTNLRKEIVREVNRCGEDVQRALERVFKFSALGRDNDTNDALRVKLRRQLYKLEWRFSHHNHVKEVRRDLAATTQRLATYLVVSNADGIQSLHASVTSQFNAMTAQLCASLMEQFSAVAEREATLLHAVTRNTIAPGELQSPSCRDGSFGNGLSNLDSSKAAAVALLCVVICAETTRAVRNALLLAAVCLLTTGGMIRQGPTVSRAMEYTPSNSITLHDAMGRRLLLPFELCQTRELFHATLVSLFSRTDGRWFIDAHRYVIVLKGQTSYCMDDTDWIRDVQPSTEIEMSIVVQNAREREHSDVVYCPVCLIGVSMVSTCSTCLCSKCGRELLSYFGRLRLPEIFDDDAQQAPKSIAYEVQDWGRFPRARPTSMSGTQRKTSTSSDDQNINSSNSRGQPDVVYRPQPSLDWWHQVHGFTRFSISQTPLRQDLGFSRALLSKPEDRLGLHLAAENGHYELAAQLLHRGVDVDASVAPGYTALHLASFQGHNRVAELLLDYGAAIDAAMEGITPLACAVYHNRLDTTALLIARGAIIDAPYAVRPTVLYAAASANNLNVVLMLLRLGVDVDEHFHNEVPLHVAVRSGHMDIVEVLLQNGADVNVRSLTGHTPLSIAALYGRVEIFALLCASGGTTKNASPAPSDQDISHLLYNGIEGGSHTIVETILQHRGADPNMHFEDGRTPLSLASEHGRVKLVELLLELGADPNADAMRPHWLKKRGAWKAWHAAVYGGNVTLIEILLQHGADVNARTNDGDTLLSIVLEGRCSWSPRYFDKVMSVLLSSGSVLNEQPSLLLQELESNVPGAWIDGVGHDSQTRT
ncbi:ankyrin [Peniophora sp. CONT]|nr:ankyrin [Peniophora sp. CONT]